MAEVKIWRFGPIWRWRTSGRSPRSGVALTKELAKIAGGPVKRGRGPPPPLHRTPRPDQDREPPTGPKLRSSGFLLPS